MRPIGVGEVLRRIMGKCVMKVVRNDVMEAVGNLQVCAGQEAGAEAAIHATSDIFQNKNCQAVLMVDAENAFNVLNRKAMLHNIARLCPSISTLVENTYNKPSRLIIMNRKELISEEGTTQGDPIAMAIYALGFAVLQDKISYDTTNVKQVAFADDLTGAGNIDDLKHWWIRINQIGPDIGYHPNPEKTCLIVKPEFYEKAKRVFADTKIKVSVEGERQLGAAIGSNEFKEKYILDTVKSWIEDIEELAQIAKTEPHAAYTNFTFSAKLKWNYVLRTIQGMERFLQPLEETIRNKFIPALIGYNVSNGLRKLISLPPRLGGMGITNPLDIANEEYENSLLLTEQLKNLIVEQNRYGKINIEQVKELKKKIAKQREMKQKQKAKMIEEEELDEHQRRRLEMAQEKGASSWLTSLPLKEMGFSLTKQEFRDAIALRYSLPIENLPTECACGESLTTDHAMICRMGGFVTMRHNELRDTIQDMIEEVCTDVKKEPLLTPLSGESLRYATANKCDNARMDMSARDFWVKGQTAYFDIRVFDPMAYSYRNQEIEKNHATHEAEKKRAYEERINKVEHGSFTPLVFTIMGGASKVTQKMLTKLSEKLSDKRGLSNSVVTAWIRVKLSFALLRSANLCLRGTRRRQPRCLNLREVNIDAAVEECRVPVGPSSK